jgi:hypothetical protein
MTVATLLLAYGGMGPRPFPSMALGGAAAGKGVATAGGWGGAGVVGI